MKRTRYMYDGSCNRRSFMTKTKAKEKAKLLKRKHHLTLYPYLCWDCGAWHLTSSETAKPAAR